MHASWNWTTIVQPFEGQLAHHSITRWAGGTTAYGTLPSYYGHYMERCSSAFLTKCSSVGKPLEVRRGDTLFAYVYVRPGQQVREIMIRWVTTDGTNARAYWGEDLIAPLGLGKRQGNVPSAGSWVRLEVPASAIGLEGKNVSTLYLNQVGQTPTSAVWDMVGTRRA